MQKPDAETAKKLRSLQRRGSVFRRSEDSEAAAAKVLLRINYSGEEGQNDAVVSRTIALLVSMSANDAVSLSVLYFLLPEH